MTSATFARGRGRVACAATPLAGSTPAELASVTSTGTVKPAESLSMLRRHAMACPAIPTCPLAITESERALPGLIDLLEPKLVNLGLADEPISIRMTGCPNGCARPYQSEIGIVGRGGTKYTLYVGGDSYGRRLNAELADGVPLDQIPGKLELLFARFKHERQGGELFGDFCERVGLDSLRETAGVKA